MSRNHIFLSTRDRLKRILVILIEGDLKKITTWVLEDKNPSSMLQVITLRGATVIVAGGNILDGL
jgi:hypothetical protein